MIPKDMPCKRDCPERYPGCFCDKKREWNERYGAMKEAIREAKGKQTMLDSFSGKRGRR